MSDITTINIDDTKPTAGSATTASVRDNFSAIKTQFSTAKNEIGAVETHAATVTGNPHAVTATEVGLGNVDNTADVNKEFDATQIVTSNVIGVPVEITNLQNSLNHMFSSGVLDGAELTDNGDGTVDIAACDMLIRPTADPHAEIYVAHVDAVAGLVLTDNDVNYLYLDYNAGAPQWVVGTSFAPINCLDNCFGYAITREGTTLSAVNALESNVDSITKIRRMMKGAFGFIHEIGGSVVGDAGTRHISVTAGAFYYFLKRITHDALDTSVTGTFDYFYRDGIGGWTKVAAQTQVDNLYYDDGSGTLALLANNKYSVAWGYMLPANGTSRFVALYGQESYSTIEAARNALAPSTVPPILDGSSVLMGRAIVQKSATELTEVASAFTQTFSAGAPTIHNELAGLNDGDYVHLTAANATDLTDGGETALHSHATAASLIDHDSLNNVMLPTDWQTVNKQGWDHFGFNQQWGGAPWGGRLPDGTDGEVSIGLILIGDANVAVGYSIANQARSQSFIAPISQSFDKAGMPIGKVGNPVDNFIIEIQTDSAGKPSGTPVTNGTSTGIPGKTLLSDTTQTIATFSTAFSLVAGTKYHVVAKRSGANDIANYYIIHRNLNFTFPNGETGSYDSGSWSTLADTSHPFIMIPTAATSTILNGEFNAADTTQLGQAPALTQSLRDVIKRDKDGKFTFQFKVGDVPTASKPLCQAYYDNDTHITVETDASSHAIIRSNGSTITGTSVLAADDSIAAMYNGTNLALYVNGVAEGVAVAASYPDDFDTGSFIIGGAIPTDLTWTKETDMSLLPSADGWTYTGTATEANAFSVSGGKLYQNAAAFASTLNGWYSKTMTLNNATGYRIDMEVQIVNGTNTATSGFGSVLVLSDGTKTATISLQEYFIELVSGANTKYVQVDLNTKSAVLSLIVKGSDLYLFANGKLIFDGTGFLIGTTATNSFSFGDQTAVSGQQADVIWHYVNYIESYEAPTFTTTALYDFGFWQKDASSLLVDLAASDVKSITGLKRDWVGGEASPTMNTKGVGGAVTTTSTSAISIPDCGFFILGSEIQLLIDATVSQPTAYAYTYLDPAIDGNTLVQTSQFCRVRQENNTTVIDRNISYSSLLKTASGMHFVDPRWYVSAGTGTLRSKSITVKGQV